jgi:ribosomal protein L11 methyltransferase
MQAHIEISFENVSNDQSSILIAFLTELGYEGFLENNLSLKAYITKDQFHEDELIALGKAQSVNFTKSIIETVNWNEKWESDFEPVRVDDFVCIRASFHPPSVNVLHEIIITPKMSFGTGHHATTQLMVKLMQKIDFNGKKVFDFGSGTGVLAILAKKLGAAQVLAIDNDPWSVENTEENLKANKCKSIEITLADKPPFSGNYEVILANINKSILLRFLSPLQKLLAPQGFLLLSGLLEEDEEDILAAAQANSLKIIEKNTHQGWLALKLAQE